MICTKCDAENPPGRSTCTMCSQPLGQSAKSESKITKKKQAFVPELLSRAPGSPLYIIRSEPNPQPVKNIWGKVKSYPEPSLHGLDLSTLEKRDWFQVFYSVFRSKESFGISSRIVNDFDELITQKRGIFAFAAPYLQRMGEVNECHLEFPDAPKGMADVLDLPISNIDQAIEVTYDFFMRPDELLDLYDWIPFDNGPEPPSTNSSRTAYVAPITTTTFIATDGFEF